MIAKQEGGGLGTVAGYCFFAWCVCAHLHLEPQFLDPSHGQEPLKRLPHWLVKGQLGQCFCIEYARQL